MRRSADFESGYNTTVEGRKERRYLGVGSKFRVTRGRGKRKRFRWEVKDTFFRGWANWAEGKPSAKRDKLGSCHGCSRCERRRRQETVRKSTRFFSFGSDSSLSLSLSSSGVWGGCVPTTTFHAFLHLKTIYFGSWTLFDSSSLLDLWFDFGYIYNPDDLGGCWLTNSIQYLSGSY